jgi:hypothetical protein
MNGKSLMLGTASLSALGYEHGISHPAIQLWNDTHHVLTSNGENAPVHTSETILQTTRVKDESYTTSS